MALELTINGRPELLEGITAGDPLIQAVAALKLKGDRVAIECNGEIAPRESWSSLALHPGDRLEIVHFVGGGS